MNTKAVALFGQPMWGKYMKLQLERRNLKVEIMHLLYEDGHTKVIIQDDYGFDTARIFKELGL